MQTKDKRLTTNDLARGFKRIIFFALLFSLVVSRWSSVASAEAWLEGAAGYEQGVAQAKSANKPMVVMFYTDWCGYCRKLQKNVLSKPEVIKALSNFVQVRINPEKGSRESQLAEEYGIQGYPTVFFETPNSEKPPMELGGATRNSDTFLAAIKVFEKK
jgi:thiol:disulfide interchange protein